MTKTILLPQYKCCVLLETQKKEGGETYKLFHDADCPYPLNQYAFQTVYCSTEDVVRRFVTKSYSKSLVQKEF